jgi:arginyl-tRNA--protein-N-Asp/Glu arginylyltransferase
MTRVLQRFIEDPHACAYLPEQTACLEVRVMVDVTTTELDALLERGWRRFGPVYFRPACEGCGECVTLRVPVAAFSPSKSQRRAMRTSAKLRRVVGRPLVDERRLALYETWHHDREVVRSWRPNEQTSDRYALDFAFPHPAAHELALYDDDRLVGVGLFDETPRSISAIFFYYDPEYAPLSPGTANVLALIDRARERRLDHVYLGYRVSGCASLRYKASFRPHELLVGRPAPDETPIWEPAEA